MVGFKHFGVMLDVSRNGVLRKEELFSFIDFLSKLGYDTLELYSEDIYQIEGEPYFGYLRGGYSINDLKEIDSYCKTKNIELIPCIQTLAHFTNPSKLSSFVPMLDIDDILNVDDPKVYEFIDKLIGSVRKAFSSKYLNIGMDEAYHLGRGEHIRKYGYESQNSLMLRHLDKVAKIASKYGFECHMWGDMFVRMANDGVYLEKLPDFNVLSKMKFEVPTNVELAYWDYGHVDTSIYDHMFKFYRNFNRDLWFVGAGYSWRGFCPQNEAALEIEKSSFISMKNNNVENYLLTLWGDNGKECSFYECLPTIFAAKEFALGIYDLEQIKKDFSKELGLNFDDFILLDKPNRISKNNEKILPINSTSKCLFYQDPLMGVFDKDLEELDFIDYEKIAKEIKEASFRNKPYSYVFDMVSSLCNFLSKKAYLGIKIHKYYKEKNIAELSNLLNEIDKSIEYLQEFMTAFETLWTKENKPFGYEVQCARFGGVKNRLEYAKRKIKMYIDGEISSIEEVETPLLPYFRNEGLTMNNYRFYISTSEI